MASSRTPLLTSPRRDSLESQSHASITPSAGHVPFHTSFHPTLYLRSLSFLLALPAFIIFVVGGPHYAPSITFLSFLLARQLLILVTHFGSRILVIKIEVVHPRFTAIGERVRERGVRMLSASIVDGIILLGLLISLSLVAREVDVSGGKGECARGCTGGGKAVEAGVVLGFIAFATHILSLPDFGSPSQLTLFIALEKPAEGVHRLVTSVLFGSLEDADLEHEGDVEQAQPISYGGAAGGNSRGAGNEYSYSHAYGRTGTGIGVGTKSKGSGVSGDVGGFGHEDSEGDEDAEEV